MVYFDNAATTFPKPNEVIRGSQTSAIKARRELEQNSISSNVVRAPSMSSEGCRFGVEVSLGAVPKAVSVLNRSGINYYNIVKPW